MVGGHCIPVVPYFLVKKAEEYGLRADIILAGRAVNDYMPKHIAKMAIKSIAYAGKALKGSKVLIMGCTYKENVADIRESPVRDVIEELHEYGIEVHGYDPLVNDGAKTFGIAFAKSLEELPKIDCIILAVAHDCFKSIYPERILGILNKNAAVIDVRGYLDIPEIRDSGIVYQRL